MIYIAHPYSHIDKFVMHQRLRTVARLVRSLARECHEFVFSPVVYCAHIADILNLGHDFDTWRDFCLKAINASSEVAIFAMEGWENSKGLKEEVKFAKQLNIPVTIFYEHERFTERRIISEKELEALYA